MKNVETQFFTYETLKLQNGTEFGPVTLAYETYGTLNQQHDNAILLFHALTGSQHAAGYNPAVPGIGEHWTDVCQTGWWDEFIGPGKAVDTDRFFVICANYFGGCYGTTGPSSINPETGKPYGGDFPRISCGDIVDSQLPLLNHFEISKLHAVIGASLGGMLTMNFAARYPEKSDLIIPLACGIEPTTLTRAHNLEQILAIENDPNFSDGHYYDSVPPVRGLALARMISHKTYVSLDFIEERAHDRYEQEHDEFSWYKISTPLESYILHQGRKLVKRFDANTYLQMIAAWSDYNLLRDTGFSSYEQLFGRCTNQRYLLFTINDDVCFYPDEQDFIRRKLEACGISVNHVTVHSDKGHDSFLLEPHLYEKDLREALNC
ncbi:MAG: homoserine O-acetyltransferase/O-succinyltransferase [Verrucomicrobiota bacterium]|jgi:homoserine O-acetyltransferase|nr:homoserine O-acetyltransferase/O-succinyltransferase [Verrucomicrobiota bacterium]MDK2963523.1 homoserine O-acetyltransferase/O-succinyltransferase [Verrucomicrobiota bacterium]